MRSTLFLAALPVLAAALTTPTKRASAVVIAGNGLCLIAGQAVYGGHQTNVSAGDVVGSGPCGYGSLWDINYGAGHVVIHGTNLALDAGANAQNGGSLTVQTLNTSSPSQNWYYTGDQRIAITGGTLCLDAKDPTDTPQVWKCTTGDTRQVWTI